ncbi:hypothetical protein O7615_13290 [Micromonospora sp. WMMD1082]|nr:hypothetical protein [Micromonospora sp. WMMD1082]MDG4794841.1 hypothetical protein [Micromonospora sp. WMMD1082]
MRVRVDQTAPSGIGVRHDIMTQSGRPLGVRAVLVDDDPTG